MADSTADDPATIVTCADATLPTGIVAAECYTPTLLFGGGKNIFIATKPFANGATPTPTATEISTALSVVAPATKPVMIGPVVFEVSTASKTAQKVRSNGNDYPTPTDLVLNLKTENCSDEMVEFARSTEKGGLSCHLYTTDANKKWYGGRNGELGGRGVLVLEYNRPAGESDVHTITGTFTRRGYYGSRRGESPVPVI